MREKLTGIWISVWIFSVYVLLFIIDVFLCMVAWEQRVLFKQKILVPGNTSESWRRWELGLSEHQS